MNAALQAVLALIEALVPTASGTVVAQAVNTLVAVAPVLVDEARDLIPIAQNIATALRGNGEVTPAMLDQLDQVDSALDAAFDKADAAAGATDPQQ